MAVDATIAGASSNSYLALEDAQAYFAARLRSDAWNTASDLQERWCRYVHEAPPPPDPHHSDRILSQPQVDSLNPEQAAVNHRQQRDEHRWSFHPSIDGCLGEDDE